MAEAQKLFSRDEAATPEERIAHALEFIAQSAGKQESYLADLSRDVQKLSTAAQGIAARRVG